jgi:hypothetical protein
LAAVIPTAILVRPHRAAPANRTTDMESQVIPMIQDVMGQTLSNCRERKENTGTGPLARLSGKVAGV